MSCPSSCRIFREFPSVSKTIYPGLISHPQHDIAKKQMNMFGGMVTFIVKGGLSSAKKLLENLEVLLLQKA